MQTAIYTIFWATLLYPIPFSKTKYTPKSIYGPDSWMFYIYVQSYCMSNMHICVYAQEHNWNNKFSVWVTLHHTPLTNNLLKLTSGSISSVKLLVSVQYCTNTKCLGTKPFNEKMLHPAREQTERSSLPNASCWTPDDIV